MSISQNRLSRIKKMLSEQPNDAFLLFALAQEQQKEDEQAALETYSLLHETHPDYVGLYFHYAKLVAKTDQNQAHQLYDQGLAVAKSQGDNHAHAELQNAKTNLSLGLLDDD